MKREKTNLSFDSKVVIVVVLVCVLCSGFISCLETVHAKEIEKVKVEQQIKAEKIKKEQEKIKKDKEELEKKIKAKAEAKEKEEQAKLEEEQKAKEQEQQSNNSSSNSYSQPVSNEPKYIPVFNKVGTDPETWQSIIDARANGFYHLLNDKGVALYFAHDYPYGKYYIADLRTGDKVNLGGTIMTVVHAEVIPAPAYMEDTADYALSYGGTAYMDTCYYRDGSYVHAVVLA